jgi:hypothetical protein
MDKGFNRSGGANGVPTKWAVVIFLGINSEDHADAALPICWTRAAIEVCKAPTDWVMALGWLDRVLPGSLSFGSRSRV